jgi:pimeloyl-ACP methyl ester carboxylesterase
MRVHAADASSILDRAGALPADVVGWSGGGLVALALAVEHPDACRSLLLIEPSVHGLRAITVSAILMTLRARIFTYVGLGRNAWDELPAEWRDGVLDHADAVAAEQSQEVTTSYPAGDQPRALALPVTIVVGEGSQRYFHRIARHLLRLVPEARLRLIRGASHAVHLDAPDEVAALVN